MVDSGESGSGVANFHLTGLSFNVIVGDNLFIWGDVLLYRFVSIILSNL